MNETFEIYHGGGRAAVKQFSDGGMFVSDLVWEPFAFSRILMSASSPLHVFFSPRSALAVYYHFFLAPRASPTENLVFPPRPANHVAAAPRAQREAKQREHTCIFQL
jgi:hypothetical protein